MELWVNTEVDIKGEVCVSVTIQSRTFALLICFKELRNQNIKNVRFEAFTAVTMKNIKNFACDSVWL
jgi:hypothetical protein